MTDSRRPATVLAALLAWALLGSAPLAAQETRFQLHGLRHGLPQQQVLALHQDVAGYLWSGTYGGLGRYNGRDFRSFSTADGLASNTVLAIASEADGTTWVGTTRGLCHLAPRAQRFECSTEAVLSGVAVQVLRVEQDTLWVGTAQGLVRFGRGATPRPPERLIADFSVVSLARDRRGELWAGTQSGLLRMAASGGHFTSAHLPLDGAVAINALLPDGDRLWIGSNRGLLRRDGERIEAERGVPEAAAGAPVSGLALDADGALWAATTRGVLRQRGARFDLLGSGDGLANDISHCILRDRGGTLWIGNDGGLDRFIPGPLVGYTQQQGLLSDFVRAIAEDQQGRLWLGTRIGVQVVSRGPDGWDFAGARVIDSRAGLVDPRIYDIDFMPSGEAWLATAHGVAVHRPGVGLVQLLTEQDGLPGNETRALYIENEDRVWIGTTLGVALRQHGQVSVAADPLLARARVLSIRRDRLGRLWFGSLHHGLLRLDPDGSVSRFNRDNGLTSEIVWDVAADAEGGVFVGSNGDGLFHIDAGGTIRRWTTADGLVDNFIWQLLVDDQGAVWSYTNRGLARFDGQRFRAFNEQDGLTHLEGSATAALQTRAGERWFAAAEGLMRFDASRRPANVAPPRVVIERAMLGSEPIEPGARLPYGARNLAFEFAAPSFERASDIRYRYRLRGNHDAWSDPLPYRPITYASLGPGQFSFEVEALGPEGAWQSVATSFPFEVAAPLWARPWFWLAAGLGLVGLVWSGIRLRIQRIEARRLELELLVDERTQALQAVNQQLEAASLTDPLTGLANRRYLGRQVQADVAQSRRAYCSEGLRDDRDISFLMVDIDHFKQINDRYGHRAGDAVLRQFADLLRGQIRASDYAVRWGGEEFVVVARQTSAAHSVRLAERIVRAARGHHFEIDEGQPPLRCSCSIGISHYPPCADRPDAFGWEQVLDLADAAVYLAKSRGRDRWIALQLEGGCQATQAAELVASIKADPEAMASRRMIRIVDAVASAALDPAEGG